MTPHGHRLKLALDLERERMLNEWFFKWHFIGREGPVEIDGFDGRNIKYGGIKFDGTARDAYWHTLKRYIRKKIDEVFLDLESVISGYPSIAARSSIDDVERELTAFVARIGQDALDTDRTLRGNGINFPPLDHGQLRRLSIANDVRERAESLRSHLNTIADAAPESTPPSQPLDHIVILRPTFWGIGVDLKAAWHRFRSHLSK